MGNVSGTHGLPGRKIFWQEGIEFWQDEVVGPPSNPDRPMLGAYIHFQKIHMFYKAKS